jgi:hypothetical protein
MRRDWASDIKLVIIPCVIYLVSSWRSMTTEIRREMTRFSHLFTSIISHTSTKHIPRPFQSLGYTKRRFLIPFPCISCISLSLNNIIGNLSSRLLKFQHRPPRSIQVPTKPSRFAGKLNNFSSLPRLIS